MIPGLTAPSVGGITVPPRELPLLLSHIDNLKAEIESLRPIDPDTLGRIEQRFRIDWNYHSNNIEGNSYDYGETKAFLLHGITAGGKPLRDSLEIKGHNEAILGLEDLIHSEMPLTEHTIREIHKKILGGEPYSISTRAPDSNLTKTVVPGRYKQEPNHVLTASGETFFFTEHYKVPAEMQELIEWYRVEESKKELHPVVLASLFHYKFVRIHPFDDGNGRMARILMNLVLMKHGFPVVIVKTEDKENYYRALRQADGEDLDAFVSYIAKQEIDSQELWLRGARGESLEDVDKEIALLKASLRNPRKRKIKTSAQYIPDLVLKVFIPLVDFASEKLAAFDDFYSNKSITMNMKDEAGNTRQVTQASIQNSPVEDLFIKKIRVLFTWGNPIDSKNALDLAQIEFGFDFKEDFYEVYLNGGLRFRKQLDEALSKDEVISLVDKSKRQLLDKLKSKAGYEL